MIEKHSKKANRPSGGQIEGWIAIVFCGLLASVNAATIASSFAARALLIAGGVVLLGTFITLAAHWYFTHREH